MRKYIVLLMHCVCLLMVAETSAQGSKIRIVNANTFEIEERGASKVKKLIGQVQLMQDNTVLYCDSAYLFDETNYVEAYRNVRINHNDSVNFYGDILKYEGQKKLARLEKNVSMVDANSILTCRQLEFDMLRNKASYYTGGKLVSGQNVLTSDAGYYFTATKELFFKRNVLLVSPDFTMHCDTLKYQTNTKIATFYGNTIIVSDNDTVYCSKGTYHTERQTGFLTNRARIRSAENTLIADSIVYDRRNKYSKAFGDIVITDTINKTIVLGDIAELMGKEKRSYVTNKALAISLIDNDTMMIWADTIFTIQKSAKSSKDIFKASKHVKVFKSDLQAACDSMVYIRQDSAMWLYQKPVLWSEANQITGDTIIFYINNKQLDSMDIINNAFVISMETRRHFNQVKGKNMKGYFVNGKIDFIQVYGNGQSIYYAKEDSAYIGVNVIDCSEMKFTFNSGKLNKAKFITQPDATFYPLDEMKPEELRLKGFVWDNKRKPVKQNLKSRKLY